MNGSYNSTITSCFGQAIEIDGSESNIGENITSINWNFGNETNDTTWPIVSHTYGNPGIYIITLEITNFNDIVTSATLEVHIETANTPIISYNEGTLSTEEGLNNYQWFYEGAVLDNDTSSFLFILDEGDYTVETTNQYGCIGTSEPYTFSTISINNLIENEISIIVESTSIKIKSKKNILNSIQLFDIEGRLIYNNQTISSNENEVSTLNYLPGIYLLKINDTISKKILIEY